MFREKEIVVLDYLSRGYPGMKKIEPIIQGIGTKRYTLLELTGQKPVRIKEVINLEDKSFRIRRRLAANQLTNFARNNLKEVVEELVEKNEEDIIKIINSAGKITIRMHKLELLPGIGKKNIQNFLKERAKKPFESFQDINNRVSSIPDIKKAVVKRILIELEKGKAEKYHLFTAP
ncbi:MAG: DUF655 domain-containing protein [Candidatus Altiarchaeales archaeon]|nr:MAG: DUF655 domain-containing protein [Candidatus Altiarchaeales archaeon]